MNKRQWGVGLCLIAGMLVMGCATRLTKPAGIPAPVKVRLGTFANVELRPVTISDAYAGAGANQKAGRKINELLNAQMAYVFPHVNAAEKKDGKTLEIIPLIKEIKFIGGAARFWAGAMAGSSAVLMEVTYLDKETGEEIARAEFYDQANAYAGAQNMGATDNLMLQTVVKQIIDYTSANR
ncbi:MAG: hypothetical protein U1E27_07015 [Kiritimatiellia bacterium]|nr:hypothetical protein [Kiritimatiellia bacterium]